MIQGRIAELQACIGITFRLPDKPDLEIEFVVDTGFEGALTLSPAVVAALGLPYLQEVFANLADDSSRSIDVHVATIVFAGHQLDVQVLAMGKRPLLGTALLAGKELAVQFVDNGLVTIDDV